MRKSNIPATTMVRGIGKQQIIVDAAAPRGLSKASSLVTTIERGADINWVISRRLLDITDNLLNRLQCTESERGGLNGDRETSITIVGKLNETNDYIRNTIANVERIEEILFDSPNKAIVGD